VKSINFNFTAGTLQA